MSQLSKKERRKMRQDGLLVDGELNKEKFQINPDIKPITDGQEDSYEAWNEGYNLILHGSAGTGKTFLGLWFGLQEVIAGRQSRLLIIRSAVQGRNQGFMPGSKEEKEAPFEAIFPGLVNFILGREDAYETLKKMGLIKFETTSFLRGQNIDDTIMLVDEMQNMTFQELDTIFTRTGHNTRLIYAGDTKQDDLTSKRFNEESGARTFMSIMEHHKSFDDIEFCADDIVRNPMIKEYILIKESMGL